MTEFLCPTCGPINEDDGLLTGPGDAVCCAFCGCPEEDMTPLWEAYEALASEKPSRQQVAAEAYQVIGALAEGPVFASEAVQNALSYFGDLAAGKAPERVKSVLPFVVPEQSQQAQECARWFTEDKSGGLIFASGGEQSAKDLAQLRSNAFPERAPYRAVCLWTTPPAPAAVPEWDACQGIVESPVVNGALCVFVENPTADSAIFLVREILEVAGVAVVPEPGSEQMNQLCWAFIEALPEGDVRKAVHQSPDVKRALHEMLNRFVAAPTPAEPESDLERDDLHYAMRLLQKMNGTFGLQNPRDEDREWFGASLRLVEQYKRKLGVGLCDVLPVTLESESDGANSPWALGDVWGPDGLDKDKWTAGLDDVHRAWHSRIEIHGDTKAQALALAHSILGHLNGLSHNGEDKDEQQAALFNAHNGAED